MTNPYKIGKLVAEEVATFTYRGYDLHIHRPITVNGNKGTAGWQISLDGVPIQDMKKRALTRDEAMQAFITEVDKAITEDEMKLLMAQCIATQKAKWKL